MQCIGQTIKVDVRLTRKLSCRKDDSTMRHMYGCPEKFRESLTAHGYFYWNFSWAFVPIEPINVRAKFEYCSFSRSWDNRGYPKKLGSPWIRPRSLFSKIFTGLLFGWMLWVHQLNLKSVAFPVPEIIGDTPKICAAPGYAHASFSPKFFMGFYLDGPSECTGQIWNS